MGYFTAKEIQLKSISRIIGGHNLLAIAPEGAGKTTTYILGALMRLRYTDDEAPKILVLVPTDEKVDDVVERFYTISQNRNLFIMGLLSSRNVDDEISDLIRGVDIVVATPARARQIYLKLGLNLNRIQTFIIDDAEEIIRLGMQTNVRELAQSCGEVQYLAFGNSNDKKLHAMIDGFMPFPTLIEIEELDQPVLDTHELLQYQTQGFEHKQALLLSLLEDREVFDKAVIFVNSEERATALSKAIPAENNELTVGISDIAIFRENPALRILIMQNEDARDMDLSGIPFIFHLELPEDERIFIQHLIRTTQEESIAISMVDESEQDQIKQIEEMIGKEIAVMPLPNDQE